LRAYADRLQGWELPPGHYLLIPVRRERTSVTADTHPPLRAVVSAAYCALGHCRLAWVDHEARPAARRTGSPQWGFDCARTPWAGVSLRSGWPGASGSWGWRCRC